ncbi:MAG: HAMP domain-containing sensor histidine kinase [Eubacteriales bacterium]|nr:HAMP domain-containing sensor histidine kinase [Eubacteriales bacterium]
MKFRTRIIIGFLMVIIMPMILFSASLYGIRYSQNSRANKESMMVEVQNESSNDQTQGSVSDDEQSEQLQKETNTENKNNLDNDGISENTEEDDSTVYDIMISDKEKFENKKNHVLIMMKDLFFSVIVILLFTAISVGLWIYRSVAAPLVQLKKATQNIKEGNLDFEMKIEGNDEFSELFRDFEDMRIRLKESAEEKIMLDKEYKELISNISHDLKTPITAVKGYIEGIMDGVADTPEKMDRYVRTIYNKTNEMDHLINELTIYSKIDTNRIPYSFSKIDVNDYFSDCAEEMGIELETKGIELSYINEDVKDDVQMIADGEQIRRVINNVISNSVKYMERENGKIILRLKDVGDFVQIEIEDNGKGIKSKDIPYIFDRFYRTDVSRNSSKGGSGIGLSVVRKILEDHGGKAWATSREGEGTTIYFVIRKYQEVPIHE